MARLTVDEAAVEARRHPSTVYKALEDSRLHGSQPIKGGRWLIKPECLDAWLDGQHCPHRQPQIRPVRELRPRSRATA